MNLYWGDLHNHCGITYGFGSLQNALDIARTHLDFCAVTGHAMWPDMYPRQPETAFVVDFHQKGFAKLKAGWEDVRRMVNAHSTQDFVTFQSYEMHSSRFGDYHFVSPDPDFPLIYRDSPGEIVRDSGCRAIAVPHHIGYTPGYRGINWDLFDPRISPVVEVYSKHGCAMRADGPFPYYHNMGPLDPRNTVAEGLDRGHRFSFVASTDHHAGFPGSYGDGVAGVWAEAKSREAIWDALLKGHTYAVTGDRIASMFSLNEAIMGERISAPGKRALRLTAQGDAPIESMIIRKNGQIAAHYLPHHVPAVSPQSLYKLRLELGWGNSPMKHHWEGSLEVEGGAIEQIQPYYRGLSALSPSDQEADSADDTNALENGFAAIRPSLAAFRCDTVRNKSTLHPQTCAFVFTVRGDLKSPVTLTVNGQRHRQTLGELLRSGFTAQMKPWHSHAYQMHTAYAAEACHGVLEYDDMPCGSRDVYQAEIVQINGQRAFVSPVTAEA